MPTAMVKRAGYPIRSTIDDGAKAVLQLIQSPDIGTGRFYHSLVEARAHDQAYDPAVRAKLKTVTEELVGLK